MKVFQFVFGVINVLSGFTMIAVGSQSYTMNVAPSPQINYIQTITQPNPHANLLFFLGATGLVGGILSLAETLIPEGGIELPQLQSQQPEELSGQDDGSFGGEGEDSSDTDFVSLAQLN